MQNKNEMASTVESWWPSNNFKLISVSMLLLLLVGGTSIYGPYSIRIIDHNIAQIIYIFGEVKARNQTETRWIEIEVDRNNLTDARLDDNLTSRKVSNSLGTLSNGNSTMYGSLPLCPFLPPLLVGPIRVVLDYPSYEHLGKLYPDLESGGHWKPEDCISRHKVAIIIPYRDRDTHLRAFLHNMHSLLRKQQLDYAIFVVEQVANQTFNKGKLMNVGFTEALKQYDWHCVIFHDVDLLPEDDRNIYSCPDQPRHMSVAIDKFSYRIQKTDIGYLGGISALRVDQFRSLNGFSNDYWGWGGEDNDMASRVKLHKYQIMRYPAHIARFKMIKHVQDIGNPVNRCRYNLMYKMEQRWKNDGLSSLNYKLLSIEKNHLYTRILVDVLEAESRKKLDDDKVCIS